MKIEKGIKRHNDSLKRRLLQQFLDADNLEDMEQFAELLQILIINTGVEIGFAIHMLAENQEEKTKMSDTFLNKIKEVMTDTQTILAE